MATSIKIVRRCAKHHCPMIPFGTGTSLDGHVQALHGGVSIDVRGMAASRHAGARRPGPARRSTAGATHGVIAGGEVR